MLFPRVEESLGQVPGAVQGPGHLAGQEGPLLVTIRRVLVQIQQSHLTMSLQHGLENILIGLLIKPHFLLLAEPEPGERSDCVGLTTGMLVITYSPQYYTEKLRAREQVTAPCLLGPRTRGNM